MRVVLDTNVIVSGTIVPAGNAARILKFLEEGAFELLISEDILAECSEVLRYPRIRKRHGRPDEQIDDLVGSIREVAPVVAPTLTLEVVTADPDDNRILECAQEGEADYIISGDAHLITLGEYLGIQILSPAAFLLVLGQGEKQEEQG
jgi:putative PIN family toxin of toxin-antitoxin system